MKSFLDIKSINKDDIINYFNICKYFKSFPKGYAHKKFQDKSVGLIFYENSTRTKMSFYQAAKKLGANVLDLPVSTSSVNKGESLKDTLQTLENIGADVFIIRHSENYIIKKIVDSKWVNVPIVNGGDGAHQHPSQALFDAYTMYEEWGEKIENFKGKNIAIVGDLSHSRVTNSNIDLLSMLGANIYLCSPEMLKLKNKKVQKSFYSLSELLKKVKIDAYMALRIQKERMKVSSIPNEIEYAKKWCLNEKRLKLLNKKAIILHPGPINRGVELSDSVADGSQSRILKQVFNSVFIRMAIIYKVFYPKADLKFVKEHIKLK